MSALATQETRAVMRWGMEREQLDLLKRTIAFGTNDDEFALFMSTSQRLGLDPFARQIYAVMRWDSRAGRQVMQVQVSIDGFRSTADKTGECDGQDGPYWCGTDGVWRDVWTSKEPPAAAKIVVFRRGQARGYTGIARFASYVQTDKSGNPNNMWKRFDDTMLAKCAEALALRKAFPATLAGVYTTDEMAQADVIDTEFVELPAPASSSKRFEEQKTDPQHPSTVVGTVELELDALEKLGTEIDNSATFAQLNTWNAACSTLVPEQREPIGKRWRAKAIKEGWMPDKAAERAKQDAARNARNEARDASHPAGAAS